MLSIVIPTLNESKTGYIKKILDAYSGIESIEILCVDGGSKDDTIRVVTAASQLTDTPIRLIKTDIQSRAGRLNHGIQVAQFKLVLLHHPRSVIEIKGVLSLIAQSETVTWGAFTHQFDHAHPLLTFTSWYSNVVRGGMRQIYYLDHCIFAKKSLLENIGLVPDVDIFEDTELCLRLRKFGKATRSSAISQTSAVRFVSNSMYRQALMNQKLKWQYYFNRSDKAMNKRYEAGLELNSEYSSKSNAKNGDN